MGTIVAPKPQPFVTEALTRQSAAVVLLQSRSELILLVNFMQRELSLKNMQRSPIKFQHQCSSFVQLAPRWVSAACCAYHAVHTTHFRRPQAIIFKHTL